MRPVERVTVFTAVYPGAEPFWTAWYRSLLAQSDRGFVLWVALDGITPDAFRAVAGIDGAAGASPPIRWLPARPGDTPAQVRQRALQVLVERCDAVVLVDSDDVLHATRVAAARAGLAHADVYACALRLVDAEGCDLGATLGLPSGADPDQVLPLRNAFGLSNTAYRSDLLRRCLPIPSEAELVDWYLATRAWLLGAAFAIDPEARMDYRQHGANMAAVLPPFDAERVRRDTERVQAHLDLAAASVPDGALPQRLRALHAAIAEAAAFQQRVVADRAMLAQYLAELASTPWTPLWWSHIARPALRAMWYEHT